MTDTQLEPSRHPARPYLRSVTDDGSARRQALGSQLGKVHRLLRAGWETALADLSLSAPQAAALRAVSQAPGCGLRELARQMNTDAMNAKRMVDHLESAGLLDSRTDPHHRQRRACWPTERGWELSEEIGRRTAQWNQHLIALVGAEELNRLYNLALRLEVALSPPMTSSE